MLIVVVAPGPNPCVLYADGAESALDPPVYAIAIRAPRRAVLCDIFLL